MLDEHKKPDRILQPGQRKAIHNGRVILVPGNADHVGVVQEIFVLFVERQIAGVLNRRGILSPGGRQWTPVSRASGPTWARIPAVAARNYHSAERARQSATGRRQFHDAEQEPLDRHRVVSAQVGRQFSAVSVARNVVREALNDPWIVADKLSGPRRPANGLD